MSQVLHHGFDHINLEPTHNFFGTAPNILSIDEIIEAFALFIETVAATGHICCIVGENGSLVPAFGETLALVDRAGEPGVLAIQVAAPDDTPLTLLIAVAAPIDRRQLSRLRLAANIYVTHAVTLLAASDEVSAHDLTRIERQCLGRLLVGQSCLDIGEVLNRSAPAIAVHVRRAMTKLGVASVAEAISLAAARGMIS